MLYKELKLTHGFCYAMKLPFLLALVMVLPAPFLTLYSQESDPFALGVRTTPPLTPSEEKKTFTLPPDFQIQLFAAEPDIAKPMNMAFDIRGRLWVTTTLEYPYPIAPDQPGRDSIKILEDTNGDGRADVITTFADGLNIPTGILPTHNGCIAWSIPNIWQFIDDDGDDRADRKIKLYGPLGWERDTHGMNSSFRRGLDGWIYATHGYNNQSTIRGLDGSELEIQSGHTYRILDNGQSVEPFAFGQVNPFGLTFDSQGSLYSADCHSAPVYQLIRGGYYPSFGKPHDGLGFGPVLMQHSHGSTAIAGIAHYDGIDWPETFHNNIFVGNVMTSRINRDQLTFNGSSPVAKEMDDFLKTTDPWFRPVDLQLGPDDALYVADFYNRIIGHYEVPLNHPGRDRFRGRIWRISYKHEKPRSKTMDPGSFVENSKDPKKWLSDLGHPNRTRRYLATQHLVDHFGNESIKPLKGIVDAHDTPSLAKIHAAWALHQLGALGSERVKSMSQAEDDLVRIHSHRILSESVFDPTFSNACIVMGLQDDSPFVRRAAADAAGRRPHPSLIIPLLAAWEQTPLTDDHLVYQLKVALREQCKVTGVLVDIAKDLAPLRARQLAEICLAVPSTDAASFLIDHLKGQTQVSVQSSEYLKHASRFLPPGREEDLIELAENLIAGDLLVQSDLFQAVQQGLAQAGKPAPDSLIKWADRLVNGLIGSVGNPEETTWEFLSLPGQEAETRVNPWFLQKRDSADGNQGSTFLCSLPPGGEQLTGVARSPVFKAPPVLSFWMAGHDGFPDRDRNMKNRVDLVLASTGEILKTSYAPRNDIAQRFEWDLSRFTGKTVYLDITDADTGTAYAWLAVGRFQPEVVILPDMDPRRVTRHLMTAVKIASQFDLKRFKPPFRSLIAHSWADATVRREIVALLAKWSGDILTQAIAELDRQQRTLPDAARNELISLVVNPELSESQNQWVHYLTFEQQQQLAQLLASHRRGATMVLQMMKSGGLSKDILGNQKLSAVLESNLNPDENQELVLLKEGLDSSGQALLSLIEERVQQYHPQSLESGAELFNTHCSNCHQVKGKGGLIGPQLDGIGNRGLARLAEDVLDPNRNIDIAFKNILVITHDGDVESGLPRREEGELLILANSTGTEFAIEKSRIREKRQTDLSLMPENFGELLNQEQFNHLMHYLLLIKD